MVDLSDKVSDHHCCVIVDFYKQVYVFVVEFDLIYLMQGSESDDMNSSTSTDRVSTEGNQMKTCVDCGTSKTPLWRGGPSGPKV